MPMYYQIHLSDMLHLLKNARSYLLNHLLYVYPSKLICINKPLMEEALEHAKCLTDTSKEGRMKDGYAISLFSWETFVTLIKKNRYEAAFFVLPFACLQESVRSTCLSISDRLKFLDIAFRCFKFHFKEITSPGKPIGITENFTRNTIGTTIGAANWIIRCINTVVGIVFALNLHIQGVVPHLHLGRLGSHDVECFFGAMRRLSMNNEQSTHAIDIVIRSMILKQCIRQLTINTKIRTRLNTGGISLTPYNEAEVDMKIEPENFINVFFNLMINAPVHLDVANGFAFQINLYTQKILHDPKYPKALMASQISGNQSTRRLILPYGANVIPIVKSKKISLFVRYPGLIQMQIFL